MSLGLLQFEFIREFLSDHTGIQIREDRRDMAIKLKPLAAQHGLSANELVTKLQTNTNGLGDLVLETVVNTETGFFRDLDDFEALRSIIIPDIENRRSHDRQLTIWCGACATGEEPYSIAILLREYFPQLLPWKLKIIASDLSHQALSRATEGLYRKREINHGLPASLLAKYFDQEEENWRVKNEIRELVQFRQINLTET